MNSVSWFLYASDLVGKVSDFCFALLIAGASIAFFGVIFGPIISMVADDLDITWAQIKSAIKLTFAVWCCAAVVYVLMPTKNTLYAIAASEVGEQVIKSESVQGITSDTTKALQQWIKRQIEPEAKK